MNNEKFVYGASSRPDGYYAVVKDKSNDEKVFEGKCDNMEDAEKFTVMNAIYSQKNKYIIKHPIEGAFNFIEIHNETIY